MTWLGKLKDSLLVQPRKVAKADPLTRYSLDPATLREVAGVQRLAELGPGNTRTLPGSALLDEPALLTLLRVGVQNKELLWFLQPSSPEQISQLQSRFGSALHLVSTPTEPSGRPRKAGSYLPLLAVRPTDLLAQELNEGVSEPFDGMDSGRLDRKTARKLRDAGVDLRRDSALRRLVTHPQFLVYVAVFVYSALRALPVSFVKEFHGSLLLFWSIDLFTAIPYTWGVLTMLFGTKMWLRLLAALTTLVTFVAPYVYFWSHGDNYPLYVPIVIAALTLFTISSELVKYFQERNLEKHYRRAVGLD